MRRWDQFLGSVASGMNIAEAKLKHFITNADIETMVRLPGDAGAVESKRWEQARLAGTRSSFTLFDFDDIFDRIMKGAKINDAMIAVKGSADGRGYFLQLVNADPELKRRYLEAKEVSSMLQMEEALEIADDKSQDVIAGPKGDIPNMAAVNRARLQVEERWRHARALAPKVYSERKQVDMNVNLNYAERLEEARNRARERGTVKLSKADMAAAVDATFREIPAKAAAPAEDTAWMDEKPKDLDTTWLEEK